MLNIDIFVYVIRKYAEWFRFGVLMGLDIAETIKE